jgi:hypothetical protein
MRKLAILSILWAVVLANISYGQGAVKYVFVDADCAAGFEALPETDQKHVLTNLKEYSFDDPGQVLFAEDEIKGLFKAAVKDQYPNSLNQLDGIYVYMLNSAEEAREKMEALVEKYRSEGIALIEMEF